MEVGIMGLTASGKSTVFGLLTGQSTESSGTRHGSVQIGIARVPDPRLDALSAMYQPDKTTPASVRYVDVPGIPEEHRQEAAFNLPELRAVDALMVVLRAFENDTVAHPLGSIDPLRMASHLPALSIPAEKPQSAIRREPSSSQNSVALPTRVVS